MQDLRDVLDYIRMTDPTVKFTIYPGGNAIPSKVVLSRPDLDELLIVGFKEGCEEGKVQITRGQVEAWIAKKGAAQ